MNLTVFTGPHPTANLTELFKRIPLGNGNLCAVVPDFQSVIAMERRLTELTRKASLGCKVYTIESLSKAILSLSGRVPETIGNHIKHALIAEIVKSRIGDQSRFYDASGYRGFMSLLISFLEDFRSTNDRIVSGDSELVSIAKAYESHLNRLGVTDHEGSIILALTSNMVERFAESFNGPLIVDRFYDLTEKQLELLSRLFKSFRRSAVTLVNDNSRPSLFSLSQKLISKYKAVGARIVEVDSKPSSYPEIVLSGFMNGEYNGYSESGEVEIHTFKSETSEADWIAGKIRTMLVDGACRPQDIMIVSRNAPDSGCPLVNVLKRYCIPVEGGVAQSLVTHPLVKLVLDALDASINPDERNILNVQSSCYTGKESSTEHFTSEIMDDRAWSCMIADVDSPDGFVSSIKNMIEWLNIKSNLNGAGEKNIAIFELVVYEKLMEFLDEFANFYSTLRPMMRAVEFSSLLRNFLSDISIAERRSPGQGVLLLGVNHARYLERDVVFIKGLDNSSFPARNDIYSFHDPEFASKIRKHKDLEEGLLFYMSISGAEGLYLTFPGIDDEGKDSSISPYLKEIREGIDSWSKPVLHTGVPGAAWEGGYVTERGKLENIIRVLKASGDPAVSLLSFLHRFNNLISETIENAIHSYIKITDDQDMNLNDDDSKEILARDWGYENIFSITELELYISCPVRFYFSRILGLQSERLLYDGLDALERGNIIHEILANFYISLKQKTGRTKFPKEEIEENRILMEKIVENAFLSRAEIFKRFHPAILGSEKRFIQRWMNHFIEIEANFFEDSIFQPQFFELIFGNGSKRPLEISDDGNTIKVGGRIDRIDISKEENVSYSRVIDYKTGKNPTYSEIEKGTVLQIPLYIKAVKENILPEIPVKSGLYYNLKEAQYDKKRKKLKGCTVIDKEIDNIIKTVSNNAVRAALSIRNGLFPAPVEECSEYCEWRTLCRGNRTPNEEINNAVM